MLAPFPAVDLGVIPVSLHPAGLADEQEQVAGEVATFFASLAI